MVTVVTVSSQRLVRGITTVAIVVSAAAACSSRAGNRSPVEAALNATKAKATAQELGTQVFASPQENAEFDIVGRINFVTGAYDVKVVMKANGSTAPRSVELLHTAGKFFMRTIQNGMPGSWTSTNSSVFLPFPFLLNPLGLLQGYLNADGQAFEPLPAATLNSTSRSGYITHRGHISVEVQITASDLIDYLSLTDNVSHSAQHLSGTATAVVQFSHFGEPVNLVAP
jgi:hypothetical protein